jgi:hypothetical protein
VILRTAAASLALALASGARAELCPGYRVKVEENALVAREDAERWATRALARAKRLDERSRCFVYVVVTAIRMKAGDEEAGWAAHVHVSARRFVDSAQLIESEQVAMFTGARRDDVVVSLRGAIESSVSKLR